MSKINQIVNGGNFNASDLSNTDVIDLLAAITLRKVTIGLDRDTGELTATPSRRTVKAVQRAQASERIVQIQGIIKDELSKVRPQKVGPLVTAVVKALGGTPQDVRQDVLLACKTLRDQPGGLIQLNESESNFHAKWTLKDSPDQFPVPTATEAAAEVSAPNVEVPAVLEASSKKKPSKPTSPSEKAAAIVAAARKRDADKAAASNETEQQPEQS